MMVFQTHWSEGLSAIINWVRKEWGMIRINKLFFSL